MDAEKIVEIGGEGGSICLFGARDGDVWHFWRGTDETTLLQLSAQEHDGPFTSRSEVVQGCNEGLRLLDRHAWVTLHPVYVHPDFRHLVYEAARDRSRTGRVPSNWGRVCDVPRQDRW